MVPLNKCWDTLGVSKWSSLGLKEHTEEEGAIFFFFGMIPGRDILGRVFNTALPLLSFSF